METLRILIAEDHPLFRKGMMQDLRLRGWTDEVISTREDERGRCDLTQARGEIAILYDGIAHLGGLYADDCHAHHALGEVRIEVAEMFIPLALPGCVEEPSE